MNITWSYSSLSLFDQCPKKYFHLKVEKSIVEPESDAMNYGKDLHLAAELFIRDGKPLPGKYAYIQPMLDTLNKLEGEKLCEYEMGVKYVDGVLTACGFHDPDRYWRGIADLLVINKEKGEARLVDYKTGKSAQYADTKQLKLLAAATFLHFPDIKKVKAGLLFVVAKDFIKEDYDVETTYDLFAPFHPIVDQLVACHENNVWNPKRNFTCKNWCPVLECSHNGKR